uniref:Uncharacterized protein n=1 Tax=Rhizophora mucronata TaxID=61149 RepID=A0A2P2NEP4_RHIMU
MDYLGICFKKKFFRKKTNSHVLPGQIYLS